MPDNSFFEAEAERFRERERERAAIKSTIDAILESLGQAERSLSRLSVFQENDRAHLARARLSLHKVLRSVEKRANTLTESNHRAGEAFVQGR